MVSSPMTKTIIATEFKAKCLSLMDEISAAGEETIVTRNGVPVGRFVPYRERPPTLFGLHGGEIRMTDDLVQQTGAPGSAEE